MGLPSWKKLIHGCFNELEEEPEPGNDLELKGSQLEKICKERGVDIRSILKSNLYPDNTISPGVLMSSKRLGALGAMTMGSRRGSVTDVVTFNYDSVLEEYLTLHGYVARVVKSLPSLTGREDVTVFHPHGYLPSASGPGRDSANVVLSKESVLKMVGDTGHPWMAFLRNLVRSKVILMVGISLTTTLGSSLGPILAYEGGDISRERPSAFWIGKGEPGADERSVLLNSNVVPVSLRSHEEIDDFLVSVCRKAAATMAR